MLTFRYVRQTRSFLYPIHFSFLYSTASPDTRRVSSGPPSFYLQPTSSSSSSLSRGSISNLSDDDLVSSLKNWFRSSREPLYETIFHILSDDGPVADAKLSRLNLPLSESLVLDILKYGKSRKEVLSCLKFFDWAGRQSGFYHTRVTFHAMFRILCTKKLMRFLLKFLDKSFQMNSGRHCKYYDTLVVGYSMAGKMETALHVFGKMRFAGSDLDSFAYNVLLNSMVEHGHFDVADMIVDQMQSRGFVGGVTHSIILKLLCKQKELDKAEQYFHSLIADSAEGKLNSKKILVGNLVNDLCKCKEYDRASNLVDMVKTLGTLPMEQAYGTWVENLVKAGNIDGALEFIRTKKEVDGYVPDLYRYNILLYRLLKRDRLTDMFNLMMEMMEQDVFPNEVTMSAILCYLFKEGMAESAMELYSFSAEFGLSLNRMAYNCVLQAIFSNMSMEGPLKNGYRPGKKTVSSMGKDIQASSPSERLEWDWYLFNQLKHLSTKVREDTYSALIHGLFKEGKWVSATNIFIDMQLKGHKPSLALFRTVVRNLCEMDDAENLFLRLLQDQLSRNKSEQTIYNCFIDAAGHAKKPELAKQVYDMMQNSGIKPNSKSEILLFQSYLKNDKISDALNFFNGLSKRSISKKKLWDLVIIGLCKVGKTDLALKKFWEMRADKHNPSIECYEELVKVVCESKALSDNEKYRLAFKIIDDLQQIGRPISTFIGNTILRHSLKYQKIYNVWIHFINSRNVTPGILKLGKLIHTFLVPLQGEEDVRNLLELMQQCFTLNLYTHNLLLRRLTITRIDYACEYFEKFLETGFKPNEDTYDILIGGLRKAGRLEEAEKLSKQLDLAEQRSSCTWEPAGILRDQT